MGWSHGKITWYGSHGMVTWDGSDGMVTWDGHMGWSNGTLTWDGSYGMVTWDGSHGMGHMGRPGNDSTLSDILSFTSIIFCKSAVVATS